MPDFRQTLADDFVDIETSGLELEVLPSVKAREVRAIYWPQTRNGLFFGDLPLKEL